MSEYTEPLVFFFQAEDGRRDAQESLGLGDVYKREVLRREVYVVANGTEIGPVKRLNYYFMARLGG